MNDYTNHPMWRAIAAIDLEPIKVKLCFAEDGTSVDRATADRMELQYRRYLFLAVTHTNKSLVPTRDIDTFWHTHILDTAKYREDCQMTFSFFLDHFPYFGLRGEEDRATWSGALAETASLYEQTFNEQYIGAGSICDGGPDCGSACAKCEIRNADPRLANEVRPTFEMLASA